MLRRVKSSCTSGSVSASRNQPRGNLSKVSFYILFHITRFSLYFIKIIIQEDSKRHICVLRFKLNWFSPDDWYYRSRGTSLVWTPTQKNDFLGPVKSSKQIKVWWSKTKQNMLEHKLNGDILLTVIPPPGTDVCFKEDLNFSRRLNRNVVKVLFST